MISIKNCFDKLNFIKVKNVCLANDPIKETDRQVTGRENMFANRISDEG